MKAAGAGPEPHAPRSGGSVAGLDADVAGRVPAGNSVTGRVSKTVLALAVASAVAIPPWSSTGADTSPRPPKRPAALPAAIEGFAPYVEQRFCSPVARPGVKAFRSLVLRTYPRTGDFGISRDCGLGGTSEHKEGRAWDWRVHADKPRERAAAASLTRWLTAKDRKGRRAAMARRVGIMYMIWNGRIWKSYEAAKGWQPYHGVSPHVDHIHFSFSWEGALRETSFYTGSVASPRKRPPFALPLQRPPKPVVSKNGAFPGRTVREGTRGPAVKKVQRKVRVAADGKFGSKTRKAVVRWQRKHGLTPDGEVGPRTWRAMFDRGHRATPTIRYPGRPLTTGSTGRAVSRVQRKVGVAADGHYGPRTHRAVVRWQRQHRLTPDGDVGPRTWRAMFRRPAPAPPRRAATPLRKYPGRPLTVGSSGGAVAAVQNKVASNRDGHYGPRTRAAVARWQRHHRLTPDGIVGPRTWQAMFGKAKAPVRKKAVAPLRARPIATLSYGSRGILVRNLQRKLGVQTSGWFGPLTERAVRNYQRRNDLVADGLAGPRTRRALGV